MKYQSEKEKIALQNVKNTLKKFFFFTNHEKLLSNYLMIILQLYMKLNTK